MRLWLRLTLYSAAVAVLPLVLVGVLAVRTTSENARLMPEEALARQAGTAATFVGVWLESVGLGLAGWHRVWELEGRSAEYQTGLVRAAWLASDAVVTVALVDGQGRPVVPPQFLGPDEVPEGREPGSAARADEFLRRLVINPAQEGVVIGTPYRPPGGGAAVVPLVVGSGGSLRLAAEVSLGSVTATFGRRGETDLVLVDGAGQPVLGGSPAWLEGPDLQQLLELHQELTFSGSATGEGLRGAAAPVPGTDWGVVAAEPSGLEERAARQIRDQTALVVLLVLLVILMLGLALERLITRPVEALRDSVRQVAGGDYQRRLPEDRVDELGDVARAFNHMAGELEQNREEIHAQHARIEAFNAELQQRVDIRTSELRQAQDGLVRAGQFAAIAEIGAGLSHELNNPLAAILGLSQMLQARGNMQQAGDRAGLARIEQQAQRCREVVATMARFSSGELDPRRAPVVDLVDTVREQVALALPAYHQRGVELEVQLSDAAVESRVEPAVADQIIGRFLAVFRAGLPDGATLTIRVAMEDGQPVVGLAADRLVASEAVRDDWRASGMQLWYARRLVDAAGARVVEPGQGSEGWRILWPAPDRWE